MPYIPTTTLTQGTSTAHEQITGNNVSITNNGSERLTWDTKDYGDDLLDLSVPSLPTVVNAGVYCISCRVVPETLTTGGYFLATLVLDELGQDAEISSTSPVQVAGGLNIFVPLSLTYFLPSDAQLAVSVTNKDGSSTRIYNLIAWVQRLN